MKFEVERNRILIIPQNEEDTAYIEDTLGLKEEKAEITARRINAIGLSCIAYIEVKKSKYSPNHSE